MNYKLGIDIGGGTVKFGVVDDGKILYKEAVSTCHTSPEGLVQQVVDGYKHIIGNYSISNIGVGVPGSFWDGGKVLADNLPLNYYPFKEELEKALGKTIALENDANAAAYGEYLYGCGRDCNNMIMLTIGTGIGGGIIIDKKIYHGTGNAGELGHFVYKVGGRKCVCGAEGCFEHYASATALVRSAKRAARRNPLSLLNRFYGENNDLNGKLIFEAIEQGCPVAKDVFDRYLRDLGLGI